MVSPGHKVFYDSRDEAVDAGYVACKVCRPSVGFSAYN
ncbi:Ada metal-binding domain-containing protein [Pelosinus fermentans]